jgi:uncharacterized protein (TIGR00369 family)
MSLPLDPELAAVLAALPSTAIDATSLADVRGLLGSMSPAGEPEGIVIDEHEVPSGQTVRVLAPTPVTSAPTDRAGLVWLHGGGFVIGDRSMDDGRLGAWVRRFGFVAVSVEYRLAPEHPYPAALDDALAALGWVHENAAKLGIVSGAIGVGGLSAGAGLAAAVALRARDEGGPPVAFQLLDSPMLDDRQTTPSSQVEDLAVWTRESNRFGWQSYLAGSAGADDVSPHAAPARADDLAGLPPALVLVGGADGFRDEDVDYALRLSGAGVTTELHVYPGGPHGFTVFPSALARQAASDVERWLARQIGCPGLARPVGPTDVDHHLLGQLGMQEVIDQEHGPSLEMAVGPRVTNPHGGLHGGLLATLLECGAAGLAVRAAGSENIVAGDLNVRFLAAVRQGPARVVGRVLRVGRRTITVQVEVIDVGDGRRVCAAGSVGYARLDDR